MKELIAASTDGGAAVTARNPVWSNDDRRIFYKLYTENFVRSAGVTASTPGINERLTNLESNNFIFLNGDYVFYYLPVNPASRDSFFRCGYFDLNEKKMTDVYKSQQNYYDISVSSYGTFFAALSRSGTATKISVISLPDIKLIYSGVYENIFDFSFSPDEKRFIVYGTPNGAKDRDIRVINIDWTED
jgi:hypothetical protein